MNRYDNTIGSIQTIHQWDNSIAVRIIISQKKSIYISSRLNYISYMNTNVTITIKYEGSIKKTKKKDK